MLFSDPAHSHPRSSTLRRLKVPMWYPWGQREIDLIAERRNQNPLLGLGTNFWVPTQEELDNPTIINYYSTIPSSVSCPCYNPPAIRRLPSPMPAFSSSTSPQQNPPALETPSWSALPSSNTSCRPGTPPFVDIPRRPGTPPSADSQQKPGQTWQEFFQDRKERQRLRKESDRERKAGEARERHPGRNKSLYFEWRRNTANKWIRHQVNRQEGQRLVDNAERGETIYDAATDTWDICEDFAARFPKPKPTAENNFEGFDDDDDEGVNDYEYVAMTGTSRPSTSVFPALDSAPIVGPSSVSPVSAPVPVHPMVVAIVPAPFPGPVVDQTPSISPFATQNSNHVPPIQVPPPPEPPFEEAIYRPSLLEFSRARYGFVAMSAPLDPPVPPTTYAERCVLMSVLSFKPSDLDGFSHYDLDALFDLINTIVGCGPGGGVGMRHMERPPSNLSICGVSNPGPKMSKRQKKNAKQRRLALAGSLPNIALRYGSSASNTLEPEEIVGDAGEPTSVDVTEAGTSVVRDIRSQKGGKRHPPPVTLRHLRHLPQQRPPPLPYGQDFANSQTRLLSRPQQAGRRPLLYAVLSQRHFLVARTHVDDGSSLRLPSSPRQRLRHRIKTPSNWDPFQNIGSSAGRLEAARARDVHRPPEPPHAHGDSVLTLGA